MVDGVGVHVADAGYDTISLLSGLLGVKMGLVAKTREQYLSFRNFISFTTENHLDIYMKILRKLICMFYSIIEQFQRSKEANL